jgi:cytoskeletal protein CcmA (bactofilin family)
VFKRRKLEGPQGADAGDDADDRKPDGSVAGVTPGVLAAAPSGMPGRPADSGLGVPPFRPAPLKEAPAMARPPFTSTPAGTPTGMPTPPAPTSANMPGSVAQRPGLPPARQPRDPAERRTLVVGRGISVQGTVQDAERLTVEGTVEASMIHATELIIALGGVFKGEVEVEDAEIAGTIDGTLTARGSLVVRATGRVLGTARCRRLQVEDGGQITGRIEMITEQPRAEAPRIAAEPAA